MLQAIPNADPATLRRSLGDLVALSTLTAVWAGAKPVRIAESLASALYTMLDARLVYVALNDPKGTSLASIAQTGHSVSDDAFAAEIGPKLFDWVRSRDPHDLFLHKAPGDDTPMRITCRQLGHNAELGVIAVGFADMGAPTPLHHLLLDVSATQTTTGLNNALLVESLRRSETRLQDQTSALETLNRTAATTAIEKDLSRVVQTVTDAGVELSGAEFGAFFYNVIDTAGESYMLYALSGVPMETFAGFPMPRNTEIFAPTFGGKGVIRSDDIKADHRYGKNRPHSGMPQGHLPVSSYLAAPVISRTGEVLGGLFFGHSATGRFTDEHESRMIGLAAQAAIAIDNARLFQEVQSANENLEARVVERTRELSDAHEALRQAQKMEAVGQLTGGIAHDFNNLLMGISGGLELTERTLARKGVTGVEHFLESALSSTRRAAALTQRLLAFSRRQTLDPRPIDIGKLIGGMEDLIRRTVGPSIQVEVFGQTDLWPALIDGAQLENALLNLAINARDAMPEGGCITVRATNEWLEGPDAHAIGVSPGDYVSISLSDTGSGIPPQVLDKIFDPFFTTKPIGQGTGLGLSMVHGFVRQSGGQIRVLSSVGEGTSIGLYLPRHVGDIGEELRQEVVVTEAGSGETLLIVDDEVTVRMVMAEVLSEAGYTIIEAHDGPSAMVHLQSGLRIDLLITDVGLPGGMNGRQIADAARTTRPDLKVLFVTGFAETASLGNGNLPAGMEVITKPFQIDELAAKVSEIIEQ